MAGDPPRAWHAKLTAMAMLFSHAEATERIRPSRTLEASLSHVCTLDKGRATTKRSCEEACTDFRDLVTPSASSHNRQTRRAASGLIFFPSSAVAGGATMRSVASACEHSIDMIDWVHHRL